MKHILIYMLPLILWSLTSCSKDDEPSSIPADAVFSMVTLTESSSSGSTFEMRKSDFSSLIVYTSKVDLTASSNKIEVGDRLVICYNRGGNDVYTSGEINLYGYILLNNTDKSVEIGEAPNRDEWNEFPFVMEAIWSTQPYLNLQTQIFGYRAIQPEEFILVADSNTVDNEYPVLYLLYKQKNDNIGGNHYMVYASFDMSDILNRDNCKGVIVKYPTLSGEKSETFEKYQ